MRQFIGVEPISGTTTGNETFSKQASSLDGTKDFKKFLTKQWNNFLSSWYSKAGGVALICVVGYFADEYYKSRESKLQQKKGADGFHQKNPRISALACFY